MASQRSSVRVPARSRAHSSAAAAGGQPRAATGSSAAGVAVSRRRAVEEPARRSASSAPRTPSWYDELDPLPVFGESPRQGASSRSGEPRAASESRPVARKGGVAVWTEDDLREEEEREGAAAGRAGARREKAKRRRTKEKAGRKFLKQYGGSDSAPSSGGSRAAVYKGEMGSSHRRASRMQNDEAAASGKGASRKRSFSVRGLFSKPPAIIAGAVAACLALVCVFLYPTAQEYYHSVREQDRLQAEYDAIVQRNESIQSQVSALSTPEGVEDRAHRQYGWVKPGDNAVNVYGLENVDTMDTFESVIVPGSVAPPETWYSKLLDPIFGTE